MSTKALEMLLQSDPPAVGARRTSTIRPHACTIPGCFKAFKMAGYLYAHLETAHKAEAAAMEASAASLAGSSAAPRRAAPLAEPGAGAGGSDPAARKAAAAAAAKFVCTACLAVGIDKRYKAAHLLREHVSVHHEKTEVFECVLCPADAKKKVFTTARALDVHRERKHDTAKKDKYRCAICLIDMRNAPAFRRHRMKAHKAHALAPSVGADGGGAGGGV